MGFSKKDNNNKGTKVEEDKLLAEYVAWNIKEKEVAKRLKELKKIVLPIVTARGGSLQVSGMDVSVTLGYQWKLPAALEEELQVAQDRMDFLSIKIKRAKADGTATKLPDDAAAKLVCRKPGKEEE